MRSEAWIRSVNLGVILPLCVYWPFLDFQGLGNAVAANTNRVPLEPGRTMKSWRAGLLTAERSSMDRSTSADSGGKQLWDKPCSVQCALPRHLPTICSAMQDQLQVDHSASLLKSAYRSADYCEVPLGCTGTTQHYKTQVYDWRPREYTIASVRTWASCIVHEVSIGTNRSRIYRSIFT